MITSHSKHSLAFVAAVALPVLSWAGTAEKATAAAPAEKINTSAITGDIGVSVYTTMYSRGTILFKQNPTILPYFDLYATAYEGDGFLNKAVLSLNVTEYYGHSKVPGPGSNSHWYENDIIPAIALTFGKITITEGYHNYTTPNDKAAASSSTFEGLNSSISFDDGDLFGAFALHPSFTYMQRTNSHGQYYEGAVAPGFAAGPVAVGFPIAVGIGEDNFYGAKDGFAYFSVGTNISYTLPMPKTYGVWKATAGVTYYSKDTDVTEQGALLGKVKNDDVAANIGLVIAF